MYNYPQTIDNGHGERLTFVRRTHSPAGETLEAENLVLPGAGPPMHTHHYQEEALTVLQGRIGYQSAGQPPRYAEAGETVKFAAGESHKFWNAGDTELRCVGYVRPPDNIEYFLGAMYDAQRRGRNGRPDLFDAAFLAWRYRSEFSMDEMPAFVRRVVLPLQVLIGRLLGKYDRYKDAPEPVRR